MSYTIDFTDFDKKFFNLVQKTIPENAKRGLQAGMLELLNDAKTKEPQAPKEFGDLWGSTAQVPIEVIITPYFISATGGFNSKYATRQHEAEPGEFNYTKTKGASRPGPKFLQSKMVRYKEKYIGIAVKFIENSKV